MTIIDPLSKAALFAAAVLGWLVACRVREHRPVAIALSMALALDALRALAPLPIEFHRAMYVACPALSAWCAAVVLAQIDPTAAAIYAAAVTCSPTGPFVAALLLQALATATFVIGSLRASVSTTCVLILAAGDAAALLGPLAWGGPWWVVQGQALLVSLLLSLVQGRELANSAKIPVD